MLVNDEGSDGDRADGVRHPVDLQLEWVLGKMPQKEFQMERLAPTLLPLSLPAELTVRDALQRVLRLPAVASKRYLTNKVVSFAKIVFVVVVFFIVPAFCDSIPTLLPPSFRWIAL